MKLTQYCACLLVGLALGGCASTDQRAPVVDGSSAGKRSSSVSGEPGQKLRSEKDWRPESVTVRKGDTLYSIAFNYGFDYRELAELNNIKDPSVISVGQQIHLFPGRSTSYPASGEIAESKSTGPIIKEQPKLVKYAYSDAALAQIGHIQEGAQKTVAKVASKPEESTKAEQDNRDYVPDGSEEGAIEWSMPAKGKLISPFSESANRKGIDIAGKLGEPILASAAGKVVYSGSGLRGYGKLIIIKHNKIYLSAYAHNDRILVKEGQSVTRGQKIAEMGSTDANRVELHFEVRRLGKPVDPAKYLPIGKS